MVRWLGLGFGRAFGVGLKGKDGIGGEWVVLGIGGDGVLGEWAGVRVEVMSLRLTRSSSRETQCRLGQQQPLEMGSHFAILESSNKEKNLNLKGASTENPL